MGILDTDFDVLQKSFLLRIDFAKYERILLAPPPAAPSGHGRLCCRAAVRASAALLISAKCLPFY